MTTSELQLPLDQLPASHLAVLRALALLPNGENKPNLLMLLSMNLIRDAQGKALNNETLGAVLGDLEHRDAIVRTTGLPYRIAPQARNAVLL